MQWLNNTVEDCMTYLNIQKCSLLLTWFWFGQPQTDICFLTFENHFQRSLACSEGKIPAGLQWGHPALSTLCTCPAFYDKKGTAWKQPRCQTLAANAGEARLVLKSSALGSVQAHPPQPQRKGSLQEGSQNLTSFKLALFALGKEIDRL